MSLCLYAATIGFFVALALFGAYAVKKTRFLSWYNAQCGRPFVGLVMIPLTIFVCFSPMILFCVARSAWVKYHEQSSVEQ